MTTRRSRCATTALSWGLSIWLASPLWAANAANDLTCDLYRPPADGLLAVCTGPFSPQDRQITIALAGAAPNTVREIRLTADDDKTPFQTIAVDARPVIDIETVGVLFMDMNFDGYADLAIMNSLDAGYRYFLYQPGADIFRASDELDAIAWPEFDKRSKTVRSYTQRADGTSGHDTFIWTNGQLRAIKAP